MRTLTTTLIAIVMTASLCAQAKPPPQAKRLWKNAIKLYEKKQYAAAGRAFESVFAVHKVRSTLFNAAKSYDKAKDAENALRLYEKFVVFGNVKGKSKDSLRKAKKRIAALEKSLSKSKARVIVHVSPPGALVLLDDDPTPRKAPLNRWIAQGKHRIVVKKSGFAPATRALSVTPGKAQRITIALQRAKDPTSSPKADWQPKTMPLGLAPDAERASGGQRSLAKKWWFWTAIGVAVVGGTVTAFLLAKPDSDPQPAPKANWGVWEPSAP
jgi:hypothetical protein